MSRDLGSGESRTRGLKRVPFKLPLLWKLLFILLARTHTYPTPVFAITQLCVRHGMAPIRLAEYGVIVESLALMISH